MRRGHYKTNLVITLRNILTIYKGIGSLGTGYDVNSYA